VRLSIATIANLSSPQFGDQRSMVRQNTNVAVTPGNLELFRAVADDHLHGRHYFELESVSHFWALCSGLLHLAFPKAQSLKPDAAFLRCRLHFFGSFLHFINSAFHVKRLLRNIIMLAFDDFLEAFDGVGNLHVTSRSSGELLGHVERLR